MPFKKGHPAYIKKHSKETREKISKAKKGKKCPHKGIPRSEETREKIRQKRKLQTFSIETRKKLKVAFSGNKNPRWKGGITKKEETIRKSFEYRLWREAVFKRDNYTCIWCNQQGGELNADHIQLFSTHPNLRFTIDNGRTLCKSCHIKRHKVK